MVRKPVAGKNITLTQKGWIERGIFAGESGDCLDLEWECEDQCDKTCCPDEVLLATPIVVLFLRAEKFRK